MSRLLVQPLLHPRFQDVERHRAVFEHDIMKRADVESCAELCFGLAAQLADLQLAELVSQRLTRPHDVAVHFDGDVLIGLAGMVAEIRDGLRAGCADKRVDFPSPPRLKQNEYTGRVLSS